MTAFPRISPARRGKSDTRKPFNPNEVPTMTKPVKFTPKKPAKPPKKPAFDTSFNFGFNATKKTGGKKKPGGGAAGGS